MRPAAIAVRAAAACLSMVMAACALASLTPVRLRVRGAEASAGITCLRDGRDVFVPLDALKSFNADWRMSDHGDAVLVTLPSLRAPVEIALARPGREPMVPVSSLASALGWSWSVADGVCDVGPASRPAAQSASPASRPAAPVAQPGVRPAAAAASAAHTEAGAAATPAPRPNRVQMAESPDGGAAAAAPVRLAPVARTEHRPRPAVDQPLVGTGTRPDVSGNVAAMRSPAPACMGAVPATPEEGGDATAAVPPAATPPAPRLARVTAVDFEALDEGHAQLRITGDAALTASARVLTNPSRLAIDLPRTVLAAEQAPVRANHSFVSAVRSTGPAGGAAQFVLDLARLVSYRIVNTANSLTVQLALPHGAGRRMKDLIVGIDPGHGGPKSGCTAMMDGKRIEEKDLTLSIATMTAKLLEEAGARVVMTRTADADVGLKDRPAMAAAQSADLFISIHIDDCPGPVSATGTTVYYHGSDADSRSLAISLSGRIARVSGIPERGATSDMRRFVNGMAVLRYSPMPSALIEVGYLSHAGDRARLVNREYQMQIAQAIVDGVRGYTEGSLPERPLTVPEGAAH